MNSLFRLVTFSSLALAAPAFAQTPSYSLEVSVSSGNIDKGEVKYARMLDPSSQLAVALELDGVVGGRVSAGLSMTSAVADFANQPSARLELAMEAAYGMTLADALALDVGYSATIQPAPVGDDPAFAGHELFLRGEYANGVLVPSVVAIADLSGFGLYMALGLSHEFDMAGLAVTPAVSLGAAANVADGISPHVNDLSATLEAKLPIEMAYLALRGGYSYFAAPDEVAGDAQRSNVFVGAAVGFEN